MKRIFKFIEKYFFIIVLLAVVISLIYPNAFLWVLGNFNGINILNLLLGIVLFTMGTTLKLGDFVNVFKNPKEITVGISAQYVIMPIIAFLLARVFSLNDALTVGLILVGTVPGGTASDVITFLSKGDVALSVSLTAVSTVISPILTPLITLLLIGNQINFNPVDMFISIIEIVIIPIILGILLNYRFPDFCEKLKDYLPGISSIVICLIVAGVIGVNKQAILTSSAILLLLFCNISLQCLLDLELAIWREWIRNRLLLWPLSWLFKILDCLQVLQRLIFQTCLKQRFRVHSILFGRILQDQFLHMYLEDIYDLFLLIF